MMQKKNIFDPLAAYHWNDWKWQMKNSIKSAEKLSGYINLSTNEINQIKMCLGSFKMAITPYYASLIDFNNPDCPIRKQCVPRIEENCIFPFEKADPLNEDETSPVKNIVHRYPNRVLFLVTHNCAMYCRHCTRKRVVGDSENSISEYEIKAAIEYIKNNEMIEDVIISGGDPLTLSDDKIDRILGDISKIAHVKIIRIGTRTPVVLPMRITPKLISVLKKHSPLYINTHFNHPKEITPLSRKACLDLANAGIPLGNQNVLLKGINDNADVLKELYMNLLSMKVKPYYMYQCDLSLGLNHFRCDINEGIELMKKLQGKISGMAIPKFVVDAPEGGGKIPILANNIVSSDGNEYTMKNYLGDNYIYPKIKH